MTEQMLYEILVFAGIVVALSITSRVILAMVQRRGGLSKADATAIQEIRSRLERIEQVTDATAIEIERIGEGQRFTTKLLSERDSDPPS